MYTYQNEYIFNELHQLKFKDVKLNVKPIVDATYVWINDIATMNRTITKWIMHVYAS